LAEATQHQREALDRLLHTASGLLGGAGFRPSPALLRGVSATLLGAAAEPAARQELEAGRLTGEREAPGFEVFAGAPGPMKTVKAARERWERAGADALPRLQRATDLERAATAHREAADQAAREVSELAERLRQARQRARAARRAADQADRQAHRARARANRAGRGR
jgi:hypothetical protein